MFSLSLGLFDDNKKILKKFNITLKKINSLEKEFSKLSDEEIKLKKEEFAEKLNKNHHLDDLIPSVFALVREASKRVLGQRHFDVQILGGLSLHYGYITEMKTGEGKTLVSTLPVYLNCLSGNSVHIMTTNEYLAKRDATIMGTLFSFLGLKISVISTGGQSFEFVNEENIKIDPTQYNNDLSNKILKPISRQKAYQADVIYGTSSEFVFDYLRDNIEIEKENLRQRDFSFAIIDEADSILIDEARNPLIISSISNEGENLYSQFSEIAKVLILEEDYLIDEKNRTVELNDKGLLKVEQILKIDNLYSISNIKYANFLENAIKVKELFICDKNYLIKDNQIVIIDEFTGRIQPGRIWSGGIHQSIEAKERLPIRKENKTTASIVYQNFFKIYKNFSGMTGTAKSSEKEFIKVYNKRVLSIPTNLPIKRIDNDDVIFLFEDSKFQAIAERISEINKTGQPILVGSVSVEKNQKLSNFLIKKKIKHEILNAKNHEREGEIIAQAGEKGKITLATNLAGRGVDIKLGGPEDSLEKKQEVLDIGGLFVLGTERYESRRIDNQLRGRSGRQGDPGETHFFVSLDDDLMRIFSGEKIKTLANFFNLPKDLPIEHKTITSSLERAQKKVEQLHSDNRQSVLSYDSVLDFQRKLIYFRRKRVLLSTNISDLILSLDFLRDLRIVEFLEKRIKELEVNFLDIKILILKLIDRYWLEHLELMNELQFSVGYLSSAQKDPLVEYKKESNLLFKQMLEIIEEKIYSFIKLLETEDWEKVFSPDTNKEKVIKPAFDIKKIGRNDLCFCGSGKKYKKCHEVNNK